VKLLLWLQQKVFSYIQNISYISNYEQFIKSARDPRKIANDHPWGRDPQVKNHWFSDLFICPKTFASFASLLK